MGWKRQAIEGLVWSVSRFAPRASSVPASPDSIFVLRNNDLGDLLVITPLFEALRREFPAARLVAGVGEWNRPVLQGNPHLTEAMSVNAPWHNKFIAGQSLLRSLRYIYASAEARNLAAQRFAVGIDILGSPQGSLLLLRAGIPFRLGVKGYAGGHTATQRQVIFDPREHVGRSALRFAEMLGCRRLPANRPQLFLSAAEKEKGQSLWNAAACAKRIVVGPGGGFAAKCWPTAHFAGLAARLSQRDDLSLAVLGGAQDVEISRQIAAAGRNIANHAGQLSLRETFALVAASDLVLCNSSMLMHVAAAFAKPTVVLLGDYFDSASQHLQQWGYPGLTQVLGKDAGCPNIYSVEAALAAVNALLPTLSPAA